MSVVRRQFVAAVGALVCVLAMGVPVAAAAEPPLTRQASSVTGESAVLNGELNPGSGSAKVTYHFAYNMGSTCTGGGVTPSEEVEGNRKTVAKTVTNLEGNTEYTFCLFAEAASGGAQPFTTLPVEPVVVGEKSELKTPDPFVAELKAEVNPENEPATSCVFEYGPTTAYGTSKACATLPTEGVTPQGVSALVEGLEADTTYHYRVVVGNAAGLFPTEGVDQTLTTEAARRPVVEGLVSSSNVAPFSATVSATVNPEFQATSCVFQYGTSKEAVEKGEGTPVPCNPPELAGGSPTAGNASLEKLEPGEEYFYRVVVENAQSRLEEKPVSSAPANFKTRAAAAPTVEKVGSSGVTPVEATLEAKVDPAYELTTCEVEYGSMEVGEHKVPCVPSLLEGGPGQTASLPLAGLEPDTIYHYNFLVKNATNSAELKGEVTTSSTKAPLVEKQGSSGETPFSANVSAEVNPEYQETFCEVQYGPENEEVAVLEGKVKLAPCKLEEGRAEKIIKAGGSLVPVTAALMGLEASEHYVYRVVAYRVVDEHITEVTDGSPVGKFTTDPERAPVIVSKSLKVVETAGPKLEITAGDAKLEAVVEPNYEETEVAFECSGSEALVLEGQGETVGAKIPAGLGGEQTVSVDLQDNLRPNTTYYCRVSATNATGGTPSETGKLLSFKTLIGPLVVTSPALEVGVTSATLVGTVNPQGVETHYRWAYVQQAVYEEALLFGVFHEFEPTLNPYLNGVLAPAESSEGIPVVAKGVAGPRAPVATQPMTIENLAPGTTYHYALVAENEHGSKTIGAGGTFTTLSAPPTVGEASVGSVTEGSAVISGSVNGQGLPTRWEVLVGTNPAALEFAASGHIEGAAGATPIEVAAGPLAAGTVYYYKVLAVSPSSPVNAQGEVEPAETVEGSFTTVAAPPPPGLAPVSTTPLLEVPKVAFPVEPKELTKKQKLEKALKTCKAKRSKSKRVGCEKQARKLYGTKTAAKKSAKKSARR
jgi:hypothetical protein